MVILKHFQKDIFQKLLSVVTEKGESDCAWSFAKILKKTGGGGGERTASYTAKVLSHKFSTVYHSFSSLTLKIINLLLE